MNGKLDAVKGCSHDNWGQPHQKRAPYSTNYADVQQRCAASFKEETPIAERLPAGMVNFYPTTADFSSYTGEDWVPENHHLFPKVNNWNGLKPTGEPGSMKGTTCDTEMDDGSTWTITRIGPIVTTGCYDWVQVGWDDIFDMSKKLEKHPDGVFIVEQFSGPVTRSGERISNPPIHIHHIHVDPIGDGGIKQRVDVIKCLQNSSLCYDPRRVMEHHGDYQCREEDGGLDCFLETVPDGYGKLVTTPLQIEGDMNDVRACNSEPYEYFYQIGARWVPKVAADGVVSSLKPINFYNYIGGGNVVFTDQSSLILTFQVPTKTDSLYWYAGRMPHGGEMLRNKMHVHNKVFKEYILFKASPYELGLTKENGLIPEKSYKPLPLPDTQFADLDEAKAFFLKNLEASAQKFDAYSEAELQEVLLNYASSDLYSRDRPEAICQAVQDLIEVDGYWYDRKVPTCCKPWHTKKDDIYTVIGFIPKLAHELGPHTDKWPDTFPSHVSMWMAWENEDEPPVSHFGILVQNQEPSGALIPEDFTLAMKIATMINGGTLPHHGNMYYDYAIPANIIAAIVMYPTTAAVVCLLGLALLMLRCYKSMRKSYYPADEIPMPRQQKKRAGSKDVEAGDRVCPDPEDVLQNIADKVTSAADDENVRALKAK